MEQPTQVGRGKGRICKEEAPAADECLEYSSADGSVGHGDPKMLSRSAIQDRIVMVGYLLEEMMSRKESSNSSHGRVLCIHPPRIELTMIPAHVVAMCSLQRVYTLIIMNVSATTKVPLDQGHTWHDIDRYISSRTVDVHSRTNHNEQRGHDGARTRSGNTGIITVP
nr:hypothetical protein CFP56_25948 [Quercus suber]